MKGYGTVDTTQRDLRTGFTSGPFLFSGVNKNIRLVRLC